MPHEFSFPFDAAFVRAALKRRTLWRGLAFAGFALAMLLGHWLWTRTPSLPLSLVVGGTTLIVSARLYFAWRSHARRIDELWAKQDPARRITWMLDDEAVEVRIGESRSRHEWKSLRRLLRYPDVWLLEVVKGLSIFFPPDAAPEPVRAYLLERCRSAGVRT